MNDVIEAKKGHTECDVKYTEKELQKRISKALNNLCSEIGMKENIFFDIMGYFSDYSNKNEMGITQTRTYPKLSADTLRRYRRNGFSKKYVFKGNKALLRLVKRSIAEYIGKDIEDPNNAIEKYALCENLEAAHLREVEENWRKKKAAFEQELFECYEAARMLKYPESDVKKFKKRLEDVTIVIEVIERISKGSPSDLKDPFIVFSDEHAALAHTLREFPEIMNTLQKVRDDANKQYIKCVEARPEDFYD